MAHTQAPIAGGQFLTAAINPNDVYVREDLTEEQRLFGQTAAEFMQKEVLPVAERLYKHDWDLTRQLLKKASDLDLLRLEIPPEYGGLGLDLISASYVGEQVAVNPSFGGSLGAHTSIGTLPLVYFGTAEQKSRYLPRLASGELIRVDTGCIVAFQPSVNYEIQYVGKIKSALFGGEGLFFATLRGPGRVWLQSLPLSRLANRIIAAVPGLTRGGREEGSILGAVGGLLDGDNS